MLTIIEIYMAVIAGNATSLLAAWIFFKPRGHVRTTKEAFVVCAALLFLVGMPVAYVFTSTN